MKDILEDITRGQGKTGDIELLEALVQRGQAPERLEVGHPRVAQVELLQLPLNPDQEPATDFTQSQGRVFALHRGFLDPATLTPGMLVTFVGEISGAIAGKIDEVDYRYPTLTVKHWYVWPPGILDDRRGGPYFGVFGGMGVGGGSRGGGGFGIGF